MNRLARVVVPAMLLALVGSAANAQPQPSLDLRAEEAAEALQSMAPTNAALVYYQLILQLNDSHLNDAQMAFDFEPADPETLQMSREEAAIQLAGAQHIIERYIWTSQLPECDFGLQFQDGVSVLLFHPGKIRIMARILRADALRLAELGEFDKAAERVEAIVRMAGQVRNDRIVVSSLVSISIAQLGMRAAEYLADHAHLTSEGRDRLIERFETLRAYDYFLLRDCMTREYTLSIGALAMIPPDAKPGQWLTDHMGSGFEQPELMASLDRMDRTTLFADAERLRLYFKEVQKVWDDDDAVDKLAALGALTQVGAYGETGKLLLPNLSRLKSTEINVMNDLDDALAILNAYQAPKKPDHATSPAQEE